MVQDFAAIVSDADVHKAIEQDSLTLCENRTRRKLLKGVKKMDDVQELAYAALEAKEAVREARRHAFTAEQDLKQRIIEKGCFGLLAVDWTKLRRNVELG